MQINYPAASERGISEEFLFYIAPWGGEPDCRQASYDPGDLSSHPGSVRLSNSETIMLLFYFCRNRTSTLNVNINIHLYPIPG